MNQYVLGINAYHGDASAALLIDGELAVAVEEERFNRIKHWAGFPAHSIRYCLDEAEIALRDVDRVAVSFDPKANNRQRIRFLFRYRPSLSSIFQRFKRRRKAVSIPEHFADVCGESVADVRAKIHRVEHHDAHVALGFLGSPYDKAAVLSIDGMGDFVSTLTCNAQGTSWNPLSRVFFPHSLGFLYNALTIYLGFPKYGDEYKVMGLAPYGEPEYVDLFRRIVRPNGDSFELNLDYFTHHRRGISMSWDGCSPIVHPFHSSLLEKQLGPPRDPNEPLTRKHENIAKSLQVVTEEIIFHLLRRLHDQTGHSNLCITGGVAMNSVAIGKVTQNTPFENVFVPAGAADNGTSIGAALDVWHQTLGNSRSFVQSHTFWGTPLDDETCRQAIAQAELDCERADEEQLLETVVDAICNGKVVGWFQGRMEFGARALGNRSLLADPRRTDMRDIINLKIKFREKFRPFAPSILEEYVDEYFEIAEPSPFMERVLPIRPDRRGEIPAVTHVDGSGRLQTVSQKTNPRFWKLIDRFRQRTGVPLLLNTSLNENEPIVRTPSEAIDCFLRTNMDLLVLGNYILKRPFDALNSDGDKKSQVIRAGGSVAH